MLTGRALSAPRRLRAELWLVSRMTLLVERLTVGPERPGASRIDRDAWPYTIPSVRHILDHGLDLHQPLTFLVGENGSGKSTLVEAIAEAYRISPRGGRGGAGKRVPLAEMSQLGQQIKLHLTSEGTRFAASRKRRSSYFLRAETAFDFLEFISSFQIILPGYWQEDLRYKSHGEGFLTVLESVFTEAGFYLMDEPEAAMSFTSCLRLVGILHDLARAGGQVICATHSPVLAATPHADVIELTEDGLRRTPWDDLDIVGHWRRFMQQPERYLRHIVNDSAAEE